MRPLPRSLDPLPGESLAGYLLRLSHRLALPPAALLRCTGLGLILSSNGQTMAKAALSTALAPATASDFAAAARLTLPEVKALTLEPWRAHYPPIEDALRFGANGRPRSVDWLFSTTVRYCPDCLAGDGSTIQQQHGGPWQALWRLPVVFACTRHGRFLEHLCPTCQQTVGTRNYSHLIARSSVPGLHPAQCRARSHQADRAAWKSSALCGSRLDQPPSTQLDRPSPELIALQEQILATLNIQQPREAAEYFADLHLTTRLVCLSWQKIRPGTSDPTIEAADRFLAERQQPGHGQPGQRIKSSNAPPVDARACAALLHAADFLLKAPDLRSALVPLLPPGQGKRRATEQHRSWDSSLRKHQTGCSERFQRATASLVVTHRLTPAPRWNPSREVTFSARHIPAFLEQEWADHHLSHFDNVATKLVRRAVAIRLVRLASRCSSSEATEFLGLHSRLARLPSRSWTLDKRVALDNATEAITGHLETLKTPVDYHRRRQTLRTWTLSQDAWLNLVDQMPVRANGRQPVLDDRKRQSVSTYVWARITQGEHLFAPCPGALAADPEYRRWCRQRNAIWKLMQPDNNCGPHYRDLKLLLDQYAQQLAETIDAGAAPTQPAQIAWANPDAQPGQLKR